MPSGLQWMVVAGVLAWASVGCDRNIAPFVPGEEPRRPDLSRIYPAPDQAPVVPRNSAPAGLAESATADASVGRPGAAVRGNVNLADAKGGRTGTLFIIARRQGAVGGPPLAVLRVPDPRFPLAFEIGPDQVMIPSMRFEGPIALTARLDFDGDAMTRDEGDPQTRTPEAVVPGSVGVELLLR